MALLLTYSCNNLPKARLSQLLLRGPQLEPVQSSSAPPAIVKCFRKNQTYLHLKDKISNILLLDFKNSQG